MTKLTWDSIRERKRRELHKKDYARADYIANFDVQKRINILMKLVNDNPPGTYEYGVTALMTNWEKFKYGSGVIFLLLGDEWEPMFVRDQEVMSWLFEEVLANLRENNIQHEEVEGYYRVRITMP